MRLKMPLDEEHAACGGPALRPGKERGSFGGKEKEGRRCLRRARHFAQGKEAKKTLSGERHPPVEEAFRFLFFCFFLFFFYFFSFVFFFFYFFFILFFLFPTIPAGYPARCRV